MADPEDRTEPPPWAVDEDVPDGEFLDEAFEQWRQYGLHAGLWALQDRITADLRAENASLRQRLADLGDDFNREREARQALLDTAIDLPDRVILEIEYRGGEACTPLVVEQLEAALAPVLAAEDFKLQSWGPRAAMRVAIAGDMARVAVDDALHRLRGEVRRGS